MEAKATRLTSNAIYSPPGSEQAFKDPLRSNRPRHGSRRKERYTASSTGTLTIIGQRLSLSTGIESGRGGSRFPSVFRDFAARVPPRHGQQSMTHGISEAGGDTPDGTSRGTKGRSALVWVQREHRMAKPTVGFIGAGHIGSQVARLALSSGYPVVISNSRGPETLVALVGELGPSARAATAGMPPRLVTSSWSASRSRTIATCQWPLSRARS